MLSLFYLFYIKNEGSKHVFEKIYFHFMTQIPLFVQLASSSTIQTNKHIPKILTYSSGFKNKSILVSPYWLHSSFCQSHKILLFVLQIHNQCIAIIQQNGTKDAKKSSAEDDIHKHQKLAFRNKHVKYPNFFIREAFQTKKQRQLGLGPNCF